MLKEDNRKLDCTEGVDVSGTGGNNFKIYNADAFSNLYYIKDKNQDKWCHAGTHEGRIYCDRSGDIPKNDKGWYHFNFMTSW